jgi:hypothetical protein
MRTTANASRTLTSERTAAGTSRRTAASDGERTTGGVSRPTLAGVPGREKKAASGGRAGVGTGGWASYNKKREERTEKFPRLEVKDDAVAIRFAEAEPFAFIYRHWVNKKPYTCIADADNDVECPLCEAGHKAKPVVFYNVITVSDIVLRVWEMTSEPTRKVQKHYDKLVAADKTLDDPGLYFVVSKSKKDNGFFEYELEKVRAADLNDETGLDPIGDDEVAIATKRGLFTDEIIQVSTRSDLADAVKDMNDDD